MGFYFFLNIIKVYKVLNMYDFMIEGLVNIISAILQGITEFFPVSSDGHLSLFSNLVSEPNLGFIVFLHLASLLAVVIFCWRDIAKLLHFEREDRRYIWCLIIGIIPAALFGYFMSQFIIGTYTLLFTGIAFIFNGLVVFMTRYASGKKDVGLVGAFIIGLAQILALFPGISRSGMTISVARFLGVRSERAFSFSFLMLIPLVVGAVIFEADKIVFSSALIVPFLVCLVVSLLSLSLLKKVVISDKFWMFGVYCLFIGIVSIVLSLL